MEPYVGSGGLLFSTTPEKSNYDRILVLGIIMTEILDIIFTNSYFYLPLAIDFKFESSGSFGDKLSI